MASARKPRARARERVDYSTVATEQPHPDAESLDLLSTEDLVAVLIDDEAAAFRAVASLKREIARAAALVADAFAAGGRLVYAGAGTSGRLGVLDAAELPPTFGVDPRRAVALIAGGRRAVTRAVEGAEDRARDADAALARLRVGPRDVVCAIAASGITPFTRAALAAARRRGARTLFVTCAAADGAAADVVLRAAVGPELIAGSTRLKGGTATKLILNAISTAAMVRLGKVYRGRMVDLRATNAKLRQRARRIVAELGGVPLRRADALLARAGGRVKLALAAAILGISVADAQIRLTAAGGSLARLCTKTIHEQQSMRLNPSRAIH